MLNCAIIMGRLTADPELRTKTNGVVDYYIKDSLRKEMEAVDNG